MKAIVRFAFLGMLFAFALSAQDSVGVVYGVVTDQTGAVIPGASVTVEHIETGKIVQLTTNEKGRYRFQTLVLGIYKFTVALEGFKNRELALEVRPSGKLRQDFVLEVGNVAETVMVEASAAVLTTQSASTSVEAAPGVGCRSRRGCRVTPAWQVSSTRSSTTTSRRKGSFGRVANRFRPSPSMSTPLPTPMSAVSCAREGCRRRMPSGSTN